ncbi:MAG: aldo/keto reductase [Thermodesulfobacteriota bacterium]
MLYRDVPKTGDRLSILGFGCMRLPQTKGKAGDGKIDQKRALRQLHQAVDQGVNYLDTAMPYHMGDSEPFLGNALADGLRAKVRIATKLPPWSVKKAEDLDRILNAQLDRLRTDHIDYYLLHALEKKNWNKLLQMDVLTFLDRARQDGRILHAGFSFHGAPDTFTEIVDAYDWQLCQIQYNFLDRFSQAGKAGLEYAAGKQLGIVIMEPLRGGNLAGRVPREVAAVWNEAPVKRTPAEWAFRWLWNHPEITMVLSGMNEEQHIAENIRIAAEGRPHSLSDQELSLVDRVEETYRRLMKAGCTGCRYCMPCPAGVDIPGCFEIYNSFHMFDDQKTARLFYLSRLSGAFGTNPAHASLCEKCGQCEKACPQGLPIQSLLEDVARTFEGSGMKIMAWVVRLFFGFQRTSSLRRAARAKKRRQ